MTSTLSGVGSRSVAEVVTEDHDGAVWERPSWEIGAGFGPILAGALDAFSEQGFHGATVRDIARRVGVKVPQLYYHHQSKEGLLTELLSTSIQHLRELVEAASVSSEDPVVRFERMVESLVRFSVREYKIIRLSSEIRSIAPDRRDDYIAERDRIEHLLTDAVLQGVEHGRFTSTGPRYDVRAILGMVQALTMWYRPEGELDEDAVVGRYVALALRVVGEATVDRARAEDVPTGGPA